MIQSSAHPLATDQVMTMADILRRWPQVGPALLAFGLPCMGCSMARFHTITEAARTHDVDEAALRQVLVETGRDQQPGV